MSGLAISFLLYTLAIAALGVWSTRFSKPSEADFLLADRGLGAWVAALSASASAESGWVTLGLVGLAFSEGVAAFWIVPGTIAAFLFNWLVLAPRLHDAAGQGALTVTDVLAARYRSGTATLIRLAATVITVSMLTAYVVGQLISAGKTFSGTFDLSWAGTSPTSSWNEYTVGVLLGAAIVLIYTVVGGFRAVAWTDVVQSAFMIVAVVLVPVVLISRIGGPAEFIRKLQATETMADPFGGRTGTAALVGLLMLRLGIPLGNSGQPHMLVRLMALRDRSALRRGALISTIWVAVLFCGAITLGLAARVYYGSLPDPEKALPHIAADTSVTPALVGGMLMAAILAAICSTADSQLLVASSAISHDLLFRTFRWRLSLPQRRRLDRITVLAVGLLAAGIATTESRSVFSFVLDYAWAGLGAGFGPALILTLLDRRTTGAAVLASMVTGVSVAIVWKQFPTLQAQVYNLVPAFFAALIVGLVVSRLSPAVASEQSSD